ncbi:MAG: type III secretion system chaperone [Ramlibacter sp.]|jgi:hypothetical protein|uniref:type III secretion system chaperone n=1 Tax=Ramlibacter sp. TaxID=1917967 RepID=UPI0026359173|nr:type III secretion system chaperone [Ramlibacter sp.]MDH4376478.1 type III secretion system chaperone [Ramlibacter sp.]
MNHRAIAEQLITSLGKTLNLPELKLDDVTHSCVLLFDENIVLNIEFDANGGQLILSAYLDEMPAESTDRVMREMMIANLYWHRTDGATLGLEELTGGIILADRRPIAVLDESGFEKWVEGFVNQTERWKKRLPEIAAGTEELMSAPAHPMAGQDGAAIFG